MADAEIEVAAEGAHKVQCSKCGAELKYKPGTDDLLCGYCGTRNTIEQSEMAIAEKDLDDFLRLEKEKTPTEHVETVECESCGAINPFDETKVAKDCIFCGGHLMVKDAVKIEQIKPQALVPFQIEHREAVKQFRKWLHGLWFAPNDLKKMQNLPDILKGVYTPYWTFDAQTSTTYSGERGINRTETEYYTQNGQRKSRTKTRTDWYPASGHVQQFFDDELILGNDTLPEEITMVLKPWDLQMLVPFSPDYLRGFLVEGYNVSLEMGHTKARKRMEMKIRQLIRSDIGGDRQRIHHSETDWSELTFKHILLPLYVSAYRYKGKSYRFLINGQTGEVRGKRPYSAWKIAFLVIAILVVISLFFVFLR